MLEYFPPLPESSFPQDKLTRWLEHEGSSSHNHEGRGAYLHLARDANQSIADGGEAISWTYAPTSYALFAAPSFPITEINIPQRGYYDLVMYELAWDTFEDGGKVWVSRTRDGLEATVRPLNDEWESSDGTLFVDAVAAAIFCEEGDILKVYIDGQSGSSENLASASCSVYLVDQISPAQLPSTYRELVLSVGPIAYWRLGEASGTTAVDETGNEHTGTYENTPTLGATGLIVDPNTAVTFVRANDEHVSVTDVGLSDFDVSSITLEAWIQTSFTGADEQQIISRDEGGTDSRVFQWRINDTTGFITFLVLEDGNMSSLGTLTGTTDVRDGLTHHVVLSYDGTTARLYIDGIEDASSTLNAAMETGSTAKVNLAARVQPASSGENFFDGTLDELAVYGRVLTPTEVREHYNVGRAV